MSILFEPMTIGDLEIPNRFVRSATADFLSDEKGHVTQKKIDVYKTLAEGEVGLIITGITHVDGLGNQRYHHSSYVDNDESIPFFRQLVESVHAQDGVIALQLYHPGREELPFLAYGDPQGVSPSVIDNDPYFRGVYYDGKHRELSEDEIWRIIQAFGDGARRAKQAGFDAIQLHGAHGYLLSQFLSPYLNRREDSWGGSLNNRLRFHREILNDIRKKVGDEYPVMIKLGVEDGFPEGLQFEEGVQAAQLLAKWGVDALEISQGGRGRWYIQTEFKREIDTLEREAYYREWAREVKQLVDIPVMMVGGLRTFELIEEIIEKGEADFVSMCRPLIREPNLVAEWREGDRHRALCVSCNDCLERIEEDLVCWLDREQ